MSPPNLQPQRVQEAGNPQLQLMNMAYAAQMKRRRKFVGPQVPSANYQLHLELVMGQRSTLVVRFQRQVPLTEPGKTLLLGFLDTFSLTLCSLAPQLRPVVLTMKNMSNMLLPGNQKIENLGNT